MGLTPLSFTGVSTFSENIQAILTRASTIASLPLRALQNEKSDLIQRKSLVASLQGTMTSFTSSLQNLADTGDAKAIGGSSSNTSKVFVNTVTATTAASYTISDITSVASAASETTAAGYADASTTAVSTTGTVRLVIGSTTYDIVLGTGQNNLAGLRTAINALGAGVSASILTTGTGANPNYLSITATATGATTLQLIDDPTGAATQMLTSANQGSNANFKLNGISVSKSNNLINDVVGGVAFTIAGTTSGAETVTVRLASDRSKLSTALSSIASAYNDVVDFLDSQIGETAGLLSGSNLVRQASSALRQLTGFPGTGAIKGLASLGLSLDTEGKLTFDSAAFNSLTEAQIADAYTFTGSTTSGVGSLVATFEGISDPITGIVKLEQNQFARTEARLNTQIADLTDRINAQQAAARSRLQVVDTLLATLESQQRNIDAQVKSLNSTLYGKTP